MNKLRVMIVADDLLVRSGLAALLEAIDEVRVVGQAAPDRFVADVEVFQPDVVMWEAGWQLDLPRAAFERPLLLLVKDASLTLASIPEETPFALLSRNCHPQDLRAALLALARGLIVVEPALLPMLNTATVQHPLDLPLEALTPREREVLTFLAQGLTNKAIAHRLGITEHTVKFHVNAIMSKLNAQSRTDAVIRATRAGWISL